MAILAVDVAGYSRNEANEEGTSGSSQAYQKNACRSQIVEHRGHIVKTTCDGMLVAFASAVDAAR